MRAKLCLMVVVMFCVCLSGAYGVENLLMDPGFEEIKKAEDMIPGTNGPWQARGSNNGFSKPTIDRKDLVEGRQSIHIMDIKAGEWTDVQQGWHTGVRHFKFEAGKTYTLSAWMKTSVPGIVNIKILNWLEPFNNWKVAKASVKEKWEEFHATALVPEETERTWCEFQFESVGDLWIDFALLYEGQYEPSEPESDVGGPVTSQDKLAFTWSKVKASR